MSETFNTHQVWFVKGSAAFLVGGKVYYGVVNGDPVNVMGDRIKIFSDRNLGTQLPNPIKTGPDGREVNKVWVGERHSIFVLNKFNVEQFQDLDRGESSGSGPPIKLTNIQGTNVITAEATPTISGYVDGQIYIFGKAAGSNTANVTLNIQGALEGAKPIKFNFNEEIAPGLFQDTAEIQVMYNSAGAPTTDHFAWVNSGRGISILTNVGGTANAITADGGPSIIGYVDGQHYQFKPTADNTGNVTLKVSNPSGFLPEHSIKSQGVEIPAGGIRSNNVYQVIYNSTGTVFELVVGFAGRLSIPLDTNGFPINTSRFTVASAATNANIWASPGGNEVDFTGTANVTDFPDAPRAGASRILHCAAACTFTNNANLAVMGAATFNAAGGDVVHVHAITTSTFRLTILKANGKAVIVIPAAFADRLLHIEDQKPDASQGGTFTSGAFQTRVLNTVVTNEITGASLSSNQITLPIGTYFIEASAPAFSVGGHKTKLQQISGTSVQIIGTVETAGAGVAAQTRSFVTGRFTIATTTILEVQHRCQTTKGSDGFGEAAVSLGAIEVYTVVKIWKVG